MIYAFSFDGTNGVPTPFSVGLPLPKSAFWPKQKLQLVTESGETVISSVTPISLWDDKSIRWCLVDGYSEQIESQKYFLTEAQASLFTKQDCCFEEDNKFILKSKDLTFQVATDSFLSLKQITDANIAPLDISPLFSLQEKCSNFTLINSALLTKTSSCNHPIYATLKQQYKAQIDEGKKYLNVVVEYKLDYPSNQLKINLSIHNPMPLIQKNGQWDLGNENSIELSTFGLKLSLPNSAFSVADSDINSGEFRSFDQWSLRINNSGGENWQSKNHVDKNGVVPKTERGAEIVEVTNKQTHKHSTLRPSPVFNLSNQAQRFVIDINHMWEKFPLQVAAYNNDIDVNFCDENAASPIELQPGEIKFHSLSIVLLQATSNTTPSLSSPALTLNPDIVCNANTIPWLTTSITQGPLNDIVNLGLTGARNFFAKREAVDEFGWRNFGDIYADHEAVGHTGEDIFVSHYNNQYDPLQGFLKQWLISGDSRWKQLADDLFEHIVNIDIYHTELDKPEYSGGLFWHTDHYVQAETASHRTYSQRQAKDVYEDHAGGGGPGSHHCYTSGLLLYYQLTGNELAKKVVIRLAKWITCFFEADGTVLGTLLQYRNRASVRNPLTGKYPLDRGTANYVNALLDCFELTGDNTYLARSSSIILQTFHHTDDFNARNFEDIENTWFYLVFLQSVAKYLWLTENMQLISHDYQIVKNSFLHYTNYVCENEIPYLKNAAKLEFPNDTWAAQDLRKIMVLKIALRYVDNEKKRKQIKNKIIEITQYVEYKLSVSTEKEFTRILALVMQNNVEPDTSYTNQAELIITQPYKTSPYSFFGHLFQIMKQYSINREIRHLLNRFPKLNLKRWIRK